MQFSFDPRRVLKESITVWGRNDLQQLQKNVYTQMKEIVDAMGTASAKVTSFPLFSSTILFPLFILYMF